MAKLNGKNREKLGKLFESASKGIPLEFQRKTLKIEDLSYWKATQFRFVLLYCSAIVLKHVLGSCAYKHFLLYFVACRILSSSEFAVKHQSYAKTLLKNFFILMPTYFGEDCQTLNNHNLLHVADDVERMRKSLSDFSAFPFENCLGMLKSLISGRKDVVPQLIKRISEIENCPTLLPEFKLTVNQPVQRIQKDPLVEYKNQTEEIQAVTVKEIKIRTIRPDNTVLLNNNTILEVTGILKVDENIFVEGHEIQNIGNSFDYPCKSSILGIWKLGSTSSTRMMINLNQVKNKCIVLDIENEKHALNFLHVE
ncbi:uncharacterized protein LOC122512906 [Leptopilina heterotoma]|uniref:uncharacterized protein LOC122512906 n=1 Tax=Leptopilina heterotoma TaxID=63436 RepID=UPI001CA8DB49|nr:uncharacterized protein LOC122512906 [Leptopilina heterotoma]